MWLLLHLHVAASRYPLPKIAIGMFIAACAYIFLTIVAMYKHYPSGYEFAALSEAVKVSMKASPWVLIVTYFFLTVAELFISPLGISFVTRWLTSSSGYLPGSVAFCYGCGQSFYCSWCYYAHLPSSVGDLGSIRSLLSHLYGCYAWYGQMARKDYIVI